MTRIQVRRGTTAAWVAANPILAIGEPGVDTTTGDFKFGDGVTAWLSLPLEYAPLLTRAHVELSDSAQPITSGVTTDITWGTEISDVDGWTAGGIATLTCPAGKGGAVIASFTAGWATSGLGTTPYVDCLINGAAWYAGEGLAPSGLHTVCFARRLAAGDTVKYRVFQNSGGSVNVSCLLHIVPVPG